MFPAFVGQVLEIEKQKLNDEVSRLVKDLVFQKLVKFVDFGGSVNLDSLFFLLLKVDDLMIRCRTKIV